MILQIQINCLMDVCSTVHMACSAFYGNLTQHPKNETVILGDNPPQRAAIQKHKSATHLTPPSFNFSYPKVASTLTASEAESMLLIFMSMLTRGEWHVKLSTQLTHAVHVLPSCLLPTCRAHCSPEAERLSRWSQSVNQLSSHHICNQ